MKPKKGHRAPEHTGVIPGIPVSQMNNSHKRSRMRKQTCWIAHHGNETVVKSPPAFNSISTNSSISTSMLLIPYRRKSCWNLWGTIRMNLNWAKRSLWTGHRDLNTMRVGGKGPWSILHRDSNSLYSVVVCCQHWSISLHICHSSVLEAAFTRQQSTVVGLVFECLIWLHSQIVWLFMTVTTTFYQRRKFIKSWGLTIAFLKDYFHQIFFFFNSDFISCHSFLRVEFISWNSDWLSQNWPFKQFWPYFSQLISRNSELTFGNSDFFPSKLRVYIILTLKD